MQGDITRGDGPPGLILAVLVQPDALVRHAELEEVQPHPEYPEYEKRVVEATRCERPEDGL